MAPRLLHGILIVRIYGIDKLHTGCGFGSCEQWGKNFLGKVKRTLCSSEIVGTALYATVDLDKARMARTRMITERTSRPHWNQSFRIYCAHRVSHVVFTIKNDNPVGAILIGRAYVPVEDVAKEFVIDRSFDIRDEEYKNIPGGSKIHVMLQFVHVVNDNSWSRGIRSRPYDYEGVPYTYFGQRQGCKVTLYQDAHVPDDFKPKIPLSNGEYYESHRCWEDIFDAIASAEHFIYMTGWSMYAPITLLRDPRRIKPKGNITAEEMLKTTLGDLLKKKADEGVKVLLLIWDDRTSVDILKEDGLMGTHDEETADYFRKTKVRCVLCPRTSEIFTNIRGYQTSSIFTHHQKTVVVDSEVPGGGTQKRRVVSFVGGIDLCDGRYDTQEHSLFRTLKTIHRDDFHQPNFPGSSIEKGGPREPWHDIHCKLEGPVAWDVLYNFEQRWTKQADKKDLFPPESLHQNLIHPLLDTSKDLESWNVQIFRSIDGTAAADFPTDPFEAARVGLITGKDNVFDRSIQDAYINAIRRAKNFIYIENQYFIGSSYGWLSKDIRVEDINALQLIPKELSLKIVSKIEAGEDFRVYIVIPMWPEGVPESASVQAILGWQRRTIEMMYADVAQAIQKKGLDDAYPRDYLTFFCLGNRENIEEYNPEQSSESNSDYYKAQKARRFMIYVHSKMMIVDDEYIIIGSANINQRSMDGARDTEIAMGAFQPRHLNTTEPARGQIYGFRIALWYEHLGILKTSFNNPESSECVRLVNHIADQHWQMYTAKQPIRDLPGFLLRYPIEVTRDGVVKNLEGTEFFPDTQAPVFGTKSESAPLLGAKSFLSFPDVTT